VGIIACVQVTTTTTLASTITPTSTSAPSTPTPITSSTTTLPTSVQTTTGCQKAMAQVGGVYVSSVTYSVPLLPGINEVGLTSNTGNGVTFQSPPDTTGLFDDNNQPIYNITLTFNPSGVNSLSSIIVNGNSNVDKFSVEFFGLSNPNQLITYSSDLGSLPVSYNSTFINSQALLVDFPQNAPSELSGILINILSTTDNQ
jgi:hypothetical protein